MRSADGTLVRLGDIATAELGAEDYDSTSWYKGKPAIFIGIEQAPGANPLTVAQRVRDLVPEVRKQLPTGLDVHIPYDASVFIEDSINEVFFTLIEAVVIVLLVIYLSLGSMRAALIPAVAVPLSLVGGAFLMLLMGFSINLLTLLAMVLAIGLVVDDAIIVVENVHRHIEMGESRFEAALDGARELAMPIIAMTTTLVAVYAPIGFMGGLVGTLFTEFAFTLAGAVLISGVVALTLSPMLSSKVLKSHGQQGRFEQWVEHFFNGSRSATSTAARRAQLPAGDHGVRRRDAGIDLLHVRHQPERAGADGGPEHPVLPGHGAADRHPRLQRGLHAADRRRLRKHSGVSRKLLPARARRAHHHLRRLQDAAAVAARALADGGAAGGAEQAAEDRGIPDRGVPAPEPARFRRRSAGAVRDHQRRRTTRRWTRSPTSSSAAPWAAGTSCS